MQSNESSYRSIFKSTFLFGFVQVFNIVMKAAIKNLHKSKQKSGFKNRPI